MEQNTKPVDAGAQMSYNGDKIAEFVYDFDKLNTYDKHGSGSFHLESDDISQENDGKSRKTAPLSVYQLYEAKLAGLSSKNGILEGQLAAALASREAAEKNLASALKSRQEIENKLVDILKEVELLKEKLASAEMAQEESNSLSNIVHSDNARLEHDVAFLKAVLDDTQKKLHSTRAVLARVRARAFRLQVEVFHLKQRLQPLDNRVPNPRKHFRHSVYRNI